MKFDLEIGCSLLLQQVEDVLLGSIANGHRLRDTLASEVHRRLWLLCRFLLVALEGNDAEVCCAHA